MIITISHEKHILNVYENLFANTKVVLLIDEAQKIGGYKAIGKNNRGDDLHNKKVKYDVALQKLKNHAIKILLITATPQDILLTESNLYAYGVVFIPEGVKYRGISTWKFNIIQEIDKDEHHVEVNDGGKHKVICIPKPFMKLMLRLSHKSPIDRTDKFNRRGKHPINVLASYQHVNELQNMTLGSFRKDTKPINDDHQEIIDANWAVMVYNQHGVRLFHESLRGMTIVVGDELYSETVSDVVGNGEFLFRHAEIGQVWDWLAHNGGVEKFPRLVTISYYNASEGITFGSTYTDDPETDANWHLTHGYIRLGNNASSAAVEQAMGRMNGNFGDSMDPPEITTSLSEKARCIKGHLLQYRWIKELANLSLFKKDVRVIDHIRNFEVFDNHVPKRFSSIPKAGELVKKRKNPHKSIEEESFKRHNCARSTMEIMAPEFFDLQEKRRKRAIKRSEEEKRRRNENSKLNNKRMRMIYVKFYLIKYVQGRICSKHLIR